MKSRKMASAIVGEEIIHCGSLPKQNAAVFLTTLVITLVVENYDNGCITKLLWELVEEH